MADNQTDKRIRWAPKIRPSKIQRLYTAEAAGLLNDEIADEVGIDLLLRVESILQAMRGQVRCPRCAAVFAADKEGLRCPGANCGWRATYEAYHQSKRHRDLNVANALPAFEAFAQSYPSARTAAAKMRLIDRLIHEFHWDAKFNEPNRSVGNNLIEGKHAEVVEFLDALSEGGGADKEEWRQTMARMWKRRRGE